MGSYRVFRVKMKVIIAGSRSITDYEVVKLAVQQSGFQITEVVSGGAHGVDALGERWAIENSIPVKQFLAAWAALGKSAGPIRNSEMAEYADALIAVYDGASKGTKDVISKMQRANKQVFIYVVENKQKLCPTCLSGLVRENNEECDSCILIEQDAVRAESEGFQNGRP
jgi:hypothetical protein